MSYKKWALPVVLAASLLALAGVIAAQDASLFPDLPPPPPKVEKPDDDVVIKSRVDLINVAATVRGKRDALIPDLKAEDFHIFEDGKEQQIRNFSRDTNLPLTIAVMIDVSQSMDAWYKDEERVGQRFLQRVIRPGDQALIAAFKTRTELYQDMTNDINALQRGILKLDLPMQMEIGTVLYDGIKLVADRRMARVEGRKVMIVFSDWADYGSIAKLEDAVEAAQKSDTVVYGIAFPLEIGGGGGGGFGGRGGGFGGGFGGGGLGGMPNFGAESLRAQNLMTDRTGGRLFKASKGSELDKIFEEIEQEMRSQYLISYASSNPNHDGKYRKIEIKVANKDYKVRARPGYWAPVTTREAPPQSAGGPPVLVR